MSRLIETLFSTFTSLFAFPSIFLAVSLQPQPALRPLFLTCLVIITFVVAFPAPIGALSSAPVKELKNRFSLCIVTDADYVQERFGGSEEAASNHTILLFELANRPLLEPEYSILVERRGRPKEVTGHFGFELHAIKFGYPGLEFDSSNGTSMLNVSLLNSTIAANQDLNTELFAYSLVLFLTNRPLSEEYHGFKRGAACSPPNNLIAVSLSRCPPSFDGKSNDSSVLQKCLVTLLHELIHSFGVLHRTNGDVMTEFGANSLNISDDTQLEIKLGLQNMAQWNNGCLTKVTVNNTVRLVTYNRGVEEEKVVSYQEVVQYMLSKEEEVEVEEEVKVEKEVKVEEEEKKEVYTSMNELENFIYMLLIFHLNFLMLMAVALLYARCWWNEFRCRQFFRHLFRIAAVETPAAAADDNDDSRDALLQTEQDRLEPVQEAARQHSKVKKRAVIADKSSSAAIGENVAIVEYTRQEDEQATTSL